MKGQASKVEVQTVKSLKEALGALSKAATSGQPWRLLAGATDVGVLHNSGHLPDGFLLNIWSLRKELGFIRKNKSQIEIGALTTFAEISENKDLIKVFPNLTAAARQVGAIQIQNRATIGGNIANASPAGDSLPALLSYDAVIKIKSSSGERLVPLTQFFLGYKKLDLKSDEMIVSVILPMAAKGTQHFYRKVGTRQAQAISKVVMATTKVPASFPEAGKGPGHSGYQFQISLGAVGPVPLRCTHVENFLNAHPVPKRETESWYEWLDRAAALLDQDISPRDDIRSSREYRSTVSKNLLKEFLKCR